MRWFSKANQTNATAIPLSRLLAKCPICEQELSGHRYATFATSSFSGAQDENFRLFMTHFRNREWAQLFKFQGWRGDTDDLACYVISGLHPVSVAVVVYKPFELYASDQLLAQQSLSPEELSLAMQGAPLKWESL